MHVAGRGRILCWEGASLWIMEALPRPGSCRCLLMVRRVSSSTLTGMRRFEVAVGRLSNPPFDGTVQVQPKMGHTSGGWSRAQMLDAMHARPPRAIGRTEAQMLGACTDGSGLGGSLR